MFAAVVIALPETWCTSTLLALLVVIAANAAAIAIVVVRGAVVILGYSLVIVSFIASHAVAIANVFVIFVGDGKQVVLRMALQSPLASLHLTTLLSLLPTSVCMLSAAVAIALPET